MRRRATIATLAAHLVMAVVSAAILLPPLWVLAAGLPNPGGGADLLAARPFAGWLLNSLAVGLGSTALALVPATTLAYALARLGAGGAGLRLAALAGWALPPIVLALPLFAVFLDARLLDTRAALIVAHAALNLPLLALVLAASFGAEVLRLEEMARLEGASLLQAFLRAALPAAAPGVLGAGLLAFVLSWNELLLALALSGEAARTLPAGLAGLSAEPGVGTAPLAAAALLACLPAVALLPLLGHHLTRGLSLGALPWRGRAGGQG